MTPIFFTNSFHPERNHEVSDFVAKRIAGLSGEFGPRCTMAVYNGDQIEAGFVLHNYYPEERMVEISAASDTPKWLTRGVISHLFNTIFGPLNCGVVIAKYAVENERVRKIWRKLGGNETIVPLIRGADKPPAVIATLTAEQWANSPLRIKA